jgi:transposase
MTITTVGIDLAKNVFAVHGVDQNGRTVLVKPKVSRAALPELIASLPPVLSGWKHAPGLTTGQDCFGSMVMSHV